MIVASFFIGLSSVVPQMFVPLAAQLSDLKEKGKNDLLKLDAVEIRPFLVEMDKKANKMFKIWSNFIINKKKSREFWLKIFNVYLWVAIWLISPIVFILHLLKYPFIANKIADEKNVYKKI